MKNIFFGFLITLFLLVSCSPIIEEDKIQHLPQGCSDTNYNQLVKLGVNSSEIIECDQADFIIDKELVSFVHLTYGSDPSDCPAGCIYSHYCALVEEDVHYPALIYLNNERDNFLNLTREFGSNSVKEKYALTGLNHSLMYTELMQQFFEEQKTGPFRWCTNNIKTRIKTSS